MAFFKQNNKTDTWKQHGIQPSGQVELILNSSRDEPAVFYRGKFTYPLVRHLELSQDTLSSDHGLQSSFSMMLHPGAFFLPVVPFGKSRPSTR